jgi:hypothetical protein
VVGAATSSHFYLFWNPLPLSFIKQVALVGVIYIGVCYTDRKENLLLFEGMFPYEELLPNKKRIFIYINLSNTFSPENSPLNIREYFHLGFLKRIFDNFQDRYRENKFWDKY